jgi:hypothetical protein
MSEEVLIAYSPTPKVVGQENSREAGKLFEGTPALFLNYLAAKIIPFTSFIKLRFTLLRVIYPTLSMC